MIPNTWPRIQHTAAPAGVATPYGQMIPPGGRVAAYVRGTNGTVLDWDEEDLPGAGWKPGIIRATLAEGLSLCRSGKPDAVIVLPGHTENVTSTFLSGLKPGTRILGGGMGLGSLIPTFTWNAAGSTFAIDDANVLMAGLKFNINGANDITKGINVTAAGCSIIGCDINVSAGTDLHAAIGIELGTGSTGFTFAQNRVIGISDAPTNVFLVAAAASDLRIERNHFDVFAHATNGLINFGNNAPLRILILENWLSNRTASSDFTIVFGTGAATGLIHGNVSAVLNNGTAATEGITFGSGPLIQLGQNWTSNLILESGLLSPAASG